MRNKIRTFFVKRFKYKETIYIEKQIIMLVQATPKTQPSGVQGALSNFKYQSPCGPSAIKKEPMPNAPKFSNRNTKKGFRNFTITKVVCLRFS